MDKRFAPMLVVFLLAGGLAFAQPAVVNSASYRGPGLSGSGIAQGSIFTIFAAGGLGPDTAVSAGAFPLQTKLGETTVKVMVGDTTKDAFILYASRTQVNAVLPSTTPVGNGTVTVTYNNQDSAPASIQVVNSAFGTFTFSASGAGQAISTDLNGQYNTIIRTFHPGDYGVLWGTGLGAINTSDNTPPPVGDLPGTIKVYVGNTTAEVLYHGRAGCCSGLDQINIKIPAGVQGCHVPIAVEAGGAVSNVGTIAVSASGQTCSDSIMGQDLVDKLASGKGVAFGYIRLENLNAPFTVGQAYRANSDYASATFSAYTPQTAGLAQYGVSSGYCIAVDCSNNCRVMSYGGSLADSSPAQLNAGGSLTVEGQSAPASMTGYGGFYGAVLNANILRFLWSGLSYTVSGTGGAAVGAFSVREMTSIPDAQFTNLTRGQNLPRSNDLSVQWSGGDPKLQNGQLTIGGYSSANTDYNRFVLFQCTAPVSAKSFTIPAWILSLLPPSGTGQAGTVTYPLGWMWIGQYNNPVTFQAEGLDRGIVTDAFFNGVGVYFQ